MMGDGVKKKERSKKKKNTASHPPADEGWVCPGWTGGRGADGSGPGRRQSPPSCWSVELRCAAVGLTRDS